MHGTRIGLAAGLAAVLLGSSALCVPAQAETLQDALVLAYTSNPTLMAARARLKAQDEALPQATAGWKPTVTLNGTWGEQLSRSTTTPALFGPPGATSTSNRTQSHPLNGSITLDQPIFSGGQTFFRLREAHATVAAGREQLRTTEQQVLLDAVTAFFNVIRDQATVELNSNNVQVLQRELQAAKDRFTVGENTRTDVAQAQARLQLAQTQLIAAQAQLVNSRASYANVIGQQPGQLEPEPAQPKLPASEQDAMQIAETNSPSLQQAIATEKAARAAVGVAYGAFGPHVSIQATASYSKTQNSFAGATLSSTNNTSSIIGQVRIPIYQGGAAFSSIRQAKHTDNQDRLQVSQTKRDVDSAVKNAWESLASARSSITSQQEQVKANKIAYQGVRQEAEVGSRTELDVLNAEQELLNSRVALVQSERDEYVAAYSLLSAVGQLNAQDLKLPVEVYDPAANARSLKWKQFWPGAGKD